MVNYQKKYDKYYLKYLNLKNQLGGECDPLPDMNDFESISHEKYNTRIPNERITINKGCYFVDELYKWVIIKGNNRSPLDNLNISQQDKQRLIDAYNLLHPIINPNDYQHQTTL